MFIPVHGIAAQWHRHTSIATAMHTCPAYNKAVPFHVSRLCFVVYASSALVCHAQGTPAPGLCKVANHQSCQNCIIIHVRSMLTANVVQHMTYLFGAIFDADSQSELERS